MSRLCYGLVIVLLCCGGQQSTAEQCQCVCPERREKLCVDLDQLDNMVRNISLERDISQDTDDERYLLCNGYFNKIRKVRLLHGCVVTRILEFYQDLFKERLGSAAKNDNLFNLLGTTKQFCVGPFRHKKKRCAELRSAAVNETFTHNLSNFNARKLSVHQIYRLDRATKQLKDPGVQNKALSELENLALYIDGDGFRRYRTLPNSRTPPDAV